MNYTIAAIETRYNGINFRSRLEAKWAAFFDLCGFKWEYEPIDFRGWVPDFFLEFPCGHSECNPTHTVYAEVKPYRSLDEFKGHPAYGVVWGCDTIANTASPFGYDEFSLGVDAVALLGLSPAPGVSVIQSMSHGSGGGEYDIGHFVIGDADELWREASNLTRWEPSRHRIGTRR